MGVGAIDNFDRFEDVFDLQSIGEVLEKFFAGEFSLELPLKRGKKQHF